MFTSGEGLAFLFVLAYLIPGFYISSISGRVSPVISPLTITEIEDVGDSTTRIAGYATRLRDCSWVETTWYLGRRDSQTARVLVTFLDPPEIRTRGVTSWEAIIVGMNPTQLLNNSYSDVTYNCHKGLYSRFQTTSTFYEGLGQDVYLMTSDLQSEIETLRENMETLQNGSNGR